MTEEEMEQWTTRIAVAAHGVTRKPKFRGYVDNADVQNHLWEWLLAHKTKVARYAEDNEAEDFERIIGFVLFDEANIYARKEKAAAMGYSVSDEFFYAKSTIEELLPSMFDREAWVNPPVEVGSGRSTRALNEGNNWLATLSDLSNAFSQMEEKDRQVLTLVFRDDVARTKLAEMWQVSRKGVDHRVEASIKRLWSALGGPRWLLEDERDTPAGTIGNRRAVSNAQARAMTDSQYEARA